MEFKFSMPTINVTVIDKHNDHGYDKYILGNQYGEPIYLVKEGEQFQLLAGYWDKEDENMSVDKYQSYMVIFAEGRSEIATFPVNNQEHMEILLTKLSILDYNHKISNL